jgi:DinB superfamily
MEQFLKSQDFLQTIAGETEKVNHAAGQLVAGLTDAQLNWKPAPNSWSIAQCLEHLAVTSERDEPYVTDAIARGRIKNSTNLPVAYRPTLFGGWLIKQLLPTATRRIPAPKIFRPAESSDIEGAIERFLRQQDQFLSLVSDARGVDYNRTRLRSAVTPFMRFSLADAFVMTVVHARRHLAQIQRVREASGFPKQ